MTVCVNAQPMHRPCDPVAFGRFLWRPYPAVSGPRLRLNMVVCNWHMSEMYCCTNIKLTCHLCGGYPIFESIVWPTHFLLANAYILSKITGGPILWPVENDTAALMPPFLRVLWIWSTWFAPPKLGSSVKMALCDAAVSMYAEYPTVCSVVRW